MLANLMKVAGVDHVITIDLHASQMQGFFKCPVDNLRAEALIAKWIRMNIRDWQESVVVSKNPGGTKRVTSLADALQLSFGIVTTDRRRPHIASSMYNSGIFEPIGTDGTDVKDALEDEEAISAAFTPERGSRGQDFANLYPSRTNGDTYQPQRIPSRQRAVTTMSMNVRTRLINGGDTPSSPLVQSTRVGSLDAEESNLHPDAELERIPTAPGIAQPQHDEDGYEESADGDDEDEV